MAEELSAVAGILTGTPDAAAEKPDTDIQDPDQEVDPSATEQEPAVAPETPPEAVEKPQKMSVKSLAEKLEMRPQDLYAALEIEVGGKTISLSELKDRGKDLYSAETKLAKAEEQTLTSENDLLRKHREMALAVQQLGREPTAQEQQQAAQLHQQYVDQENRATLSTIGDWSDQVVRTDEVKLIGATLTEYGFSPVEIDNIVDHRQVKLLRDYTLLRQRLKAAGESEVRTVKKLSGKSRRRSAPTNKSAVQRFRSGELSQNAAVITAIADGATGRSPSGKN